MDWICQLGDGYMLGWDGCRLHRVHTGYPYPTLTRPQMEILYDFVHSHTGNGLSWREFELSYKGIIQHFNDSFTRLGEDCIGIADAFNFNSRATELECIYRTEYWSAYKVLDIDDIIYKLGDLYSDSQFYNRGDGGMDTEGLALIVSDKIYDRVSVVLPICRDLRDTTTADNYLFEGLPFAFFCEVSEFGYPSYKTCSCVSDRMRYFLSSIVFDREKGMMVQSLLNHCFSFGCSCDDHANECSLRLSDFKEMFPYATMETSYNLYRDLLLEFGVECDRRRVLLEFFNLADTWGKSHNSYKFKVRGVLVYTMLAGVYDAYTHVFVNNEDKFGLFHNIKESLNSCAMFRFALKEVQEDDVVVFDLNNIVDKDITLTYFKDFYCDSCATNRSYDFDPVSACKEFLLNVGVNPSFLTPKRMFLCNTTLDFAKKVKHPITLKVRDYDDYGIVYLFFHSLFYETMVLNVTLDKRVFKFKNILSCFEGFRSEIDYDLLLSRYSIVFKNLLLSAKYTSHHIYRFVLRKDLDVRVSADKNSIEVILMDKA